MLDQIKQSNENFKENEKNILQDLKGKFNDLKEKLKGDENVVKPKEFKSVLKKYEQNPADLFQGKAGFNSTLYNDWKTIQNGYEQMDEKTQTEFNNMLSKELNNETITSVSKEGNNMLKIKTTERPDGYLFMPFPSINESWGNEGLKIMKAFDLVFDQFCNNYKRGGPAVESGDYSFQTNAYDNLFVSKKGGEYKLI